VTTSIQDGATVATFLLDKGASRFTVRAFAGGMLSVMGHNPTIAIRDFSGEASFDPSAPDKASLQVRIRADSLEVTDDISGKDRREMERTMNQTVLESAKYPVIEFAGTDARVDLIGDGRYKVAMKGSLALHGVTRSLPVDAQMTSSPLSRAITESRWSALREGQ
jgi:polyisoprenoid-binding protein YceI